MCHDVWIVQIEFRYLPTTNKSGYKSTICTNVEFKVKQCDERENRFEQHLQYCYSLQRT